MCICKDVDDVFVCVVYWCEVVVLVCVVLGVVVVYLEFLVGFDDIGFGCDDLFKCFFYFWLLFVLNFCGGFFQDCLVVFEYR